MFLGAFLVGGLIYALSSLYQYVRYGQSASALKSETLISLTNQDRVEAGVQTLSENPLLTKAAQLKADDMATRRYYAHENPDGNDVRYWVGQVGYGYLAVGENLYLTYRDEQHVNDAWMKSPAHRSNMLLPVFTETGVGVAQGWYKGYPATFIVAVYGKPAPQAKGIAQKNIQKVLSKNTSISTTTPVVVATPITQAASSDYFSLQIRVLTKQLRELRAQLGIK